MENKTEVYELMEDYLQGTLEGEELALFEQQLKQDRTLQEELALYRQIRTATADQDINELEVVLDASFDEYRQKQEQPAGQQPATKNRKGWIVWLVFILLAVLAAWLFINYFSAADTPEKIYAQFAQHEFALQEMGADEDLMNIQNLLNGQDYTGAISAIEAYQGQYDIRPDLLLAKGISLLETDQYDSALEVFSALCQNYPLYRNEAIWYEALTYLKNERLPAAYAALRAIPKGASRYKDARALSQTMTEMAPDLEVNIAPSFLCD
ncbi:MAG: hypothetical protein R2824_09905 [Saprospiraceae bacterium]